MNKPNTFCKDFQIWKACGMFDSQRAWIEYVFFMDCFAYATNTHILAKVPLRYLTTFPQEVYELLDGYCIHKQVLKYLSGLSLLEIEKQDDGLAISGKVGQNKISVTMKRNEEMKPPTFESLFKEDGHCTPISKIGISQKLLDNLTSAIGTTEIKMSFSDESRRVIVQPINEDMYDIKGIIMPILTTGTFDFEKGGEND